MSEIRTYLKQVDRNSLLRSGGTHPAIIELVRAFEAGGGTYDEDAEQYVEAACGDLPPHQYHGHPERDEMTYTLGTAVYNAKKYLRDETARARLNALTAQGFAPLEGATIIDGGRYLLSMGTLYVGREQATYRDPMSVRAVTAPGHPPYFLPPRARTRGFNVAGPALVKEVTA
jgi:hypothetical protein